MWVMIPRIGRFLGIFHHRVSRRLMGRQSRRGRDGGWVYTPLSEKIEEVGLLEVKTYVSYHQITVTHFIATGLIMDLLLAA